ncbi:MAG: mannosyltransferase B-like protein [Candidatus Yanofskybacteria bacterium GW2011_GWA1_44_21]|uniref:Glycosyl transferase family 1 domain-containing protein n=2 Tax=Candidatus Yanofskyibacteriota TaxID=1752733 RepID=A0A1F8H0I0_9BACT|nr:MAG: mannosyltransferase B-like protein [Candidatus Yanofskybacteria bacterium GW2011_GWA2_44_10]KKT50888.1 MAG: mannosyltransferase B-like protein [Candidatus Yanofskybacteria bacterium GW2011_GWA1_44_21]KKT90460.1 MAG: mannosyltransferase B-like protein [Candidatus Yanofskybacteria bacterium GW2011_GWB1_45_11]OGN03106.1 MAG: hypothetical protein A2657_01770 [Candidatus Yanofskybacteria bacterium RIFCSPHIGHO2_01_FULL_44_110b]OGN14267.1 MAG: hypothetical protein A3C01_01595 [Candidatus Yanof
MTIGIDIRVLGAKQWGGIQEYTENLLAHVLPLTPLINYKLFYSSYKPSLFSNSQDFDFPWLKLPNVELINKRIPNRTLFLGSNVLNQPKLDRLIGGTDVFFFPHFLLGSLTDSCRRITTFHDLSFIHFPEMFSLKRRMWHFHMQPRWQAKFSDRIIAVSESTKNDLADIYDIDGEKISVIYQGCHPSFRPLDEEAKEIFKWENSLPERFILSLATLEPRKNLRGIIKAFEIVRKNHPDLHLVIAGSEGWLAEEFNSVVSSSTENKYIRLAGNVDRVDRVNYYNCALALVYPSFFEGFGLPPLEAMACSTPVIVSHTSSLPEVVGDAGILVDPYDASDIAKGIECVLSDSALSQKLKAKGLNRAEKFSWPQIAEKTLEVLTS